MQNLTAFQQKFLDHSISYLGVQPRICEVLERELNLATLQDFLDTDLRDALNVPHFTKMLLNDILCMMGHYKFISEEEISFLQFVAEEIDGKNVRKRNSYSVSGLVFEFRKNLVIEDEVEVAIDDLIECLD